MSHKNDVSGDAVKALRSFLISSKGKQALRKLRKTNQVYLIASFPDEELESTTFYGVDGSGLVSLVTEESFTEAKQVKEYVARNHQELYPISIVDLLSALSEGPTPIEEVVDSVVAHLTMAARGDAMRFGNALN
jgi:hypothetical protein